MRRYGSVPNFQIRANHLYDNACRYAESCLCEIKKLTEVKDDDKRNQAIIAVGAIHVSTTSLKDYMGDIMEFLDIVSKVGAIIYTKSELHARLHNEIMKVFKRQVKMGLDLGMSYEISMQYSLGSWLFVELTDRIPSNNNEDKLVGAMGKMVYDDFCDYWIKPASKKDK